MNDCLFCKIIKGEIPSEKVYEDEWVYAFNDINPVAPIHFLVVPKVHVKSVNELTAESGIACHIFEAIKKITANMGISGDGYRVVTNCGENAGQTVGHLHFHVIGGKTLGWPQ